MLKHSQFAILVITILMTLPSCILKSVMEERTKFFESVMGINENSFNQPTALQNAITFDGPSHDPFLPGRKPLAIARIHELDATLAPTQNSYRVGYFEEMSIKDLREATKSMKPGNGAFNVIEAVTPWKNEDILKKVDSGSLQANPTNKDAVFQVASNFNGLEFMSPNNLQVHDLVSYLGDPTQGPFAAISAFPGLVVRDYYVFHNATKADSGTPTQAQQALSKNKYAWAQSPDEKKTNSNNGQINFLDQTSIPVKQGYVMLEGKKIDNPQAEIEKMKIGYHGDIQVTFGFKSADSKTQEKIDDKTQIINQVFTAAMDVTRNYSEPQKEEVARAILHGAYEGTLRSALFKVKKNVILTLIGGGVFENDIRWIADALKDLESFIIESGLNITLIVFNSDDYTKPSKPKGMWSAAKKTLQSIVTATGGSYIQYTPKNPEGIVEITSTIIAKTQEPAHSEKALNQLAESFVNITRK